MLPGFDEDTGAVETVEPVGLAGKASVVSGGTPLVDLMRKGGPVAIGGLLLAVVAVLSVAWWPRSPTVPDESPVAPPQSRPPVSSGEDSLGLSFPELTERWNEVAAPPAITKGIPRTPETGRFDAFTYRFNESSLLAGAYDDRSEDLYALLADSYYGEPGELTGNERTIVSGLTRSR